ncbi:bifunctional enoyl-CoA hydratase/phosphate acetyltransferase [Pelagimonas sp. KU-00592-HH]|uniref:bifunctional enoyl-CoA hydratase/phosphate acetyltransferase n=1 Tax=Pelagimonas sp. KU-00592-HH TaxID=3127651 RepID=UPI0031036F66
MQYIENRTFDEIAVGDVAEMARTLTAEDIELFAVMSGDVNPAHLDPEFAKEEIFHKVIAHGMWGGALISAVLGTKLPGPGTIYLNQSLSFRRPVGLGDTITTRVTVREKHADKSRLVLDCACLNDAGKPVILGEAEVIAPDHKIRREPAHLPDVHLHHHGAIYDRLLARGREFHSPRIAVIAPVTQATLEGPLEARRLGISDPLLIGPEPMIRRVADDAGLSLDGAEILHTDSISAAQEAALALAEAGEVDAIDQGTIRIDKLVKPVRERLRTGRILSHVVALDVPGYQKPLLVTDGLVNVAPDLDAKAGIIRNAIDLAHTLLIDQPRVAILSAVEEVTPAVPSTLDAAALCKMAHRGQITGAVLDGPLAFDTAISMVAAKTMPGRGSDVAGQADILVAPDFEAGNMIAKQLTHLAGAEMTGLLMGAKVPVLTAGRNDGMRARIASAALASLYITRRGA